jgi:hypothetical protein
VSEAVVHLRAARLSTAALAHRCDDVAGELLDLEQLDGEIVEGVVALVEPLEQRLATAIGLDGGPRRRCRERSAPQWRRGRAR